MSPKDLRKLAAACRAAGIKSFKNSEVEFTLGDIPAPRTYNKRTQKEAITAHNEINETVIAAQFAQDSFEALTEEAKLFWSSGPSIGQESAQ